MLSNLVSSIRCILVKLDSMDPSGMVFSNPKALSCAQTILLLPQLFPLGRYAWTTEVEYAVKVICEESIISTVNSLCQQDRMQIPDFDS